MVENLPKDILYLIFNWLHSEDLEKMPLVCKKFAQLDYKGLWRKLSRLYLRSQFFWKEETPMIIPDVENAAQWQSLMNLAMNIASGAPSISTGDDYANDLVVNCLHLFWKVLGPSYQNEVQLHYINPSIFVEITPIMYEKYGKLQADSVAEKEIINCFSQSQRYKDNPYGGYFYAWGDVIKNY